MRKNKKGLNESGDWYRPPKKKMKKGMKLLLVLACIVLAGVIVFQFLPDIIMAVMNNPLKPFDSDPETLAVLAPKDEEAAERIAAMPGYSKDDTWAVYVYLVGSNLESGGLDELSMLTHYLIADEVEAYQAQAAEKELSSIRTFVDEVTAQGVDLPQILYRPDTSSYKTANAGADEPEDDGTPIEDTTGFASSDFNDMMNTEYSDNVTLIVQTGGAARWRNSLINPNRSQRFVMSSAGIEEIYDEPLVNMADPETLTDFIKFCDSNYSADHKMLLLWNHGGGFTGFGNDEIFGMDCLSLAEIRSAIENAVGSNAKNPPFEVIGFDACLMASTEAVHELTGLGRYLLASEETEPATGWDYETWLPALCEDPGMNGAQLGRIVADSYVELSLSSFADLGYISPTTFSVIDLTKGDRVYDAYCAFAAAALKKAGEDPSFLTELSRAAGSTIAYAGNAFRVLNTIDLGGFMEEIQPVLPEAGKVLKALDEAVLYNRSSSYLKDSMGLSVYFPARIEGIGGISHFLKYVNDVSENDDVNALYYYKIAGCLNEELSDYAASKDIGEFEPIDYSVLNELSGLDIALSGDGDLAVQLPEEYSSLLQSVRMGIAKYDEKSGDIEYYGEDVHAFLDDDGRVSTDFDGSWLYFGGKPLPLEIMSVTGDRVMFSTDIYYNFMPATLITGYDAETGEVSVLGVRLFLETAAVLDRNLLPLENRDVIEIRCEAGNLYSNAISDVNKTVIYREGKTKLEERPLKDGDYYQYIIFEDLRCDTYYSEIVSLRVKGGEIVSQQLDPTVFGFDKN